jgi:hypothetical protein
MDLSLFLARFLGLYMLIILGIWLLRKTQFEAGLRNVVESEATFALTAIIQIILGLLIVLSHSIWTYNWQGLITLFGYFAIFQGVMRLAFPDEIKPYIINAVEKRTWMMQAFLDIVGAFFFYHGFIGHGA